MGKWLDKLRAGSDGIDGCGKFDKEHFSERLEEHVGINKHEGGLSQDASNNLVNVRQLAIKADRQCGDDVENRTAANIAFGEFGVEASCKQPVIYCLECRHCSPGEDYGSVNCARGVILHPRQTRWTRRYCDHFEER